MPKKSDKKSETEKKLEDKGEPEKSHKKLTAEEYEKKVMELVKKDLTSEKIGEMLRKEGIHPKEHGKISKILRKNDAYIGPDVKNMSKKLEKLELHLSKNKQDKKAVKQKEKIFGNLRKLKKYYEKK
ncbi:MAG: hypothetical protein WAU65_01050 [Candidatus Nanoarchaeia archaeon]